MLAKNTINDEQLKEFSRCVLQQSKEALARDQYSYLIDYSMKMVDKHYDNFSLNLGRLLAISGFCSSAACKEFKAEYTDAKNNVLYMKWLQSERMGAVQRIEAYSKRIAFK